MDMTLKRESPCIFSGFPLEPADHLRENQAWLDEQLTSDQTRVISFCNGKALMEGGEQLKPKLLSPKDFDQDRYKNADFIFLGIAKEALGQVFFAVSVDPSDLEKTSQHGKFIDLRSIGMQLGREQDGMTSLLARGKVILDWHDRHGFCAACGVKTIVTKGGYMRKCPDCKAVHFPRTDPVVIMMVTYGEGAEQQCLLGRGTGFPAKRYSTLAGFMEPGETIEESVMREVKEEVGLEVHNVRYVKSQPWPFPSNLMIGCTSEAKTQDLTLDEKEIIDAFWVTKSDVRAKIEKEIETGKACGTQYYLPQKLAIARHLLEIWAYEN